MPRHYTPPLTRFHVCVLYHEAKLRKIPMTRLANDLVRMSLKDSHGWKQAEEAMQFQETPPAYATK